MSEMIGSTYRIIKRIGAGGGGIVYLAYHERLQKKVILKADKRQITTRSDLLRREVDVLKELSHTYIPQVYDFFVENDIVYTVIDFIEGESLNKPLERGERFSQPVVIKWARQILEALKYLHSPTHGNPPRGYVHSDIKPANIMKKKNGDVCLIDFNIALALGEKNAVGCSRGYSSPELYGLDFSSNGQESESARYKTDSGTEILQTSHCSVTPDVRSDIYSLGATLYHLLSGRRPAKDAKEVVPLSKKEFSPQLVDIITKAMNPNPDLRYQTAQEMLNAFWNLYQNDIRVVRWRRRNLFVYTACMLLTLLGTVMAFTGLKRIQTTERWMRLTEEAENQLQDGNRAAALDSVMQVYSEQENFWKPQGLPKTQKTLTEILGVYDLSDGFRADKNVALPSAPLVLEIAPDERTALCMCLGQLNIINISNAEIILSIPAERSALAGAAYLDSNRLIFSGVEGLTLYDLNAEKELWHGEKATGIAVSGNKKYIAAIYKEEKSAVIYDTETGEIRNRIFFKDKHQKTVINDVFLNPLDNLFALNEDGSLLAVSFSDGSLEVFDVNPENGNKGLEIFDGTVDYSHFEGGFYKQYLAVAATAGSKAESVFAIVDTNTGKQTGGFQSEGYYFANADEHGICVGVDNILVEIDPESGEQKALADTAEKIEQYSYDGTSVVTATGNRVSFYDGQTNETGILERDTICDLLDIKNQTAVIGSSDSPILWIAKKTEHSDSEIAVFDTEYLHDEARISHDRKYIMLFSYNRFRICDLQGHVICDVDIPDADNVYDQQYVRETNQSYLEVTYNDGKVDRYDGTDGALLETRKISPPDGSLDEEFVTSRLRIESPLHGSSKVYDRQSGKLIAELNEDAYLTYVTEVGGYLAAQYVTADHHFFGYLMNQNCQILAYMPNLCDVLTDSFLFDYPDGSIREAKLYELEELQEIAAAKTKEENGL